jgi:hypothetical protein
MYSVASHAYTYAHHSPLHGNFLHAYTPPALEEKEDETTKHKE